MGLGGTPSLFSPIQLSCPYVCAKDINLSFTSVCVKEMHPLLLTESQLLLLTVISAEQTLTPKKQILVTGHRPQQAGKQEYLGHELTCPRRGRKGAASQQTQASISSIAKWPRCGNMASNLHRHREHKTLSDEQCRWPASHVQRGILCLGISIFLPTLTVVSDFPVHFKWLPTPTPLLPTNFCSSLLYLQWFLSHVSTIYTLIRSSASV